MLEALSLFAFDLLVCAVAVIGGLVGAMVLVAALAIDIALAPFRFLASVL